MVSIPVSDTSSPVYRILPGTGYDGVVRVSTGSVYGTGTLLPGGRHMLTAAHVVEDAVLTGLKVFLSLPGAETTLSAATLTLHPAYQPTNVNNDLAIIRLSEPAPAGAERFDIYRDGDEVGQGVTLVGYGAPATGATGLTQVSETPTKRAGTNRIDAGTDTLKTQPLAGVGWQIEPDKQLALDFDDGTPARDALGRLLGRSDLGQGASEVFISPGDSGGPLLIDGKIAGLASYTFGVSLGATGPDVNNRTDSSFGEIGSAVRVFSYAEWIDRTLRADLPDVPTQPEAVAREIAEGNNGTSLAYFLVQLGEPGPAGGSVDYRTLDGTARAGEDYVAASGRLVLYPGETSAVIAVEVIGDTRAEGPETFFLEVFNPQGGTFVAGLGQLRATRTILDDDGAIPLPVIAVADPWGSGTGKHVLALTSLYNTALDRAPDDAGLAFWVGQAEGGQDYTSLASAFLGSQEFRDRFGTDLGPELLVPLLYRNAFGREPEPDALLRRRGLLETPEAA